MTQTYHGWPFLPASKRTAAQNAQWWQDCFVTTTAIENLVSGSGSIAMIGNKGNGKTTAIKRMVHHIGDQALILPYSTLNWPHGPRSNKLEQNHIGRIMATAATAVASYLEQPDKMGRAAKLNPLQHEFLCWLIEKHLGRRALIRLAYRFQKNTQIEFDVPETFDDIYETTTLEADVWGQIGELGELAEALDFAQIMLLLDLSKFDLSLHLHDLTNLLTNLDLLEHPNWVIRAALPTSNTIQNRILNHTSGRLHPIRLEYTEAQREEVIRRHLRAATDGRIHTLESLADTAVLVRAQEEIQKLYGVNALAGWLNWAETLLHLSQARPEFNDAKLSKADKAVLTYYKRHILLQLDKERQGVWRGPEFISLENQPFELMRKLFALRGHSAPDALYDIAGSVANLNTLANRLRNKVEPIKGKTNIYLHNRRDQGYWLENILF